MLSRSIAIALLATVMVGGGTAVNRAEAAAAAPVNTAITTDETILDARWVCGPTRCEWRAWSPGPQHRWASGWGPPRNPGCHWEKRRGRWRQICPW